MNLNEYKKFYVCDEGHFYLSKIKQYTPKAIIEMAKGLSLFMQLLSNNPNSELLRRYESFRPKEIQETLFEIGTKQVQINIYSKLFLSLLILENDLVDLSQMKVKNENKYQEFMKLKKEFSQDKSYNFFIQKYDKHYLESNLTVYFRNFESWLSKFGFFGRYENDMCFFTEAGYEFTKGANDINLSSAIFLNQIKKIQIWNPTINEKYKDIKVVPYYLILEILLKIPNNSFSRNEYVLFITKIKSHTKKEIDQAVKLIREFRDLANKKQKQYIENINKLDRKKFPKRPRTNYERLIDSHSKEIPAYTFGGISIFDEKENVIKLINIERAKEELEIFKKSPQYIDFTEKYDWIRHLGNLGGLSVDEIVDLYVREGKTAESIKESLKEADSKVEEKIKNRLLEKEIEEYYEQNLDKIDSDLEIVKKPNYGRQFPTHIGSIDLLCIHRKTQEYYVIEFKKSQVSDDTIGQILRYMGWVHLNLTVRTQNWLGYETCEVLKTSQVLENQTSQVLKTCEVFKTQLKMSPYT